MAERVTTVCDVCGLDIKDTYLSVSVHFKTDGERGLYQLAGSTDLDCHGGCLAEAMQRAFDRASERISGEGSG